MTTVTAVIPTYNHARYLPAALDSVLAQTRPADEILVVDDGSTDETGAVLRQYEDRVSVLRQRNAGVSAARNAGIGAATGTYLAFLDADDAWLPRKLELQLRCFERDHHLGLVHTGVQEIDASGHPGRVVLDGREGHVATDLLLLRPTVLGGGSGLMVPRRLLVDVGGFDVDLSTSADWDLFYRLAQRRPVCFVPEVLLQYRIHGSNMHGDIDATRRDMLRAFTKAFEGDPGLRRLRRRSYGRLHLMLSGSYAGDRRPIEAIRHGALAMYHDPRSAARVLGTPLRRLRRGEEMGP